MLFVHKRLLFNLASNLCIHWAAVIADFVIVSTDGNYDGCSIITRSFVQVICGVGYPKFLKFKLILQI